MANIPLFKVLMRPEAIELADQVLLSGYVGQGPKVDEFEQKLEGVFGAPVLTVNSCTSAIELALHLIGVGPGDEVVSTANTCTASNSGVVTRGATLVWADVDQFTGLIDPESVAKLITPKTKAIIAVDWSGAPCDYDRLRSFGVPVIEDAAHAFLATYKGKPIAQSGGDYVCFPPTTTIATAEGPKRIDSVRPGDRVLSQDGQYHPVLKIHKNKYDGNFSRIKAGQARIACTERHPILVFRDGGDLWVEAREVRLGDYVYVKTKACSKCGNLVPEYGYTCKECFVKSDQSMAKRLKVQAARGVKKNHTSRNEHHEMDVLPWMLKYHSDGFRVIPFIRAFPDFIAIKDGRIHAVEVEDATSVRLGKANKYDALGEFGYDQVDWITRPRSRPGSLYSYVIVGHLARVPVVKCSTGPWKHNRAQHGRNVYNLTVDGDPTYFARSILVHNCWSFQAIKHLTTVDGGALKVRSDEFNRARLLRWYGLDRRSGASFRCSQCIQEIGYKFHMNDLAAAIGIGNLPRAIEAVGQCQYNAAVYNTTLVGLPGVTIPRYEACSHWLYTILVDDRDSFVKHMAERGIDTSQVHARNDRHAAFKAASRTPLPTPGLDFFSAHQIAIPVGWWLSKNDLERVINGVVSWSKKL